MRSLECVCASMYASDSVAVCLFALDSFLQGKGGNERKAISKSLLGKTLSLLTCSGENINCAVHHGRVEVRSIAILHYSPLSLSLSLSETLLLKENRAIILYC